MKKGFSIRVKALREAYRLTQNEFAMALGLKSSLGISKMETGQILSPRQETIDSMVKVFSTTHEWLVSGDGEMLPNGICRINLQAHEKSTESIADPYKDLVYIELKESNNYLQTKLNDAMSIINRLIDGRGSSNLGKSKALRMQAEELTQFANCA